MLRVGRGACCGFAAAAGTPACLRPQGANARRAATAAPSSSPGAARRTDSFMNAV